MLAGTLVNCATRWIVLVDVTYRFTLGLVAAAALLLSGCGDSDSGPIGKAPQPKPRSTQTTVPSKPYTIEQLAAQLGCKPKEQGKAKDFRQAACPVDGENVVLLQFDKAKGQEDWLDYATGYGGVYLSGNRWVLSGVSEEYMQGLQKKLGGTIKEGDSG
jgi:hypothetical protein